MTGSWQTRRRSWAVLATVVGFVMLATYLALIVSEGTHEFAEVAPWASAMLAAAALSLVAAITEIDKTARMLLLASAALSLAIGVVSIFSLGIGFLAAGLMALYAANKLPRSGN